MLAEDFLMVRGHENEWRAHWKGLKHSNESVPRRKTKRRHAVCRVPLGIILSLYLCNEAFSHITTSIHIIYTV